MEPQPATNLIPSADEATEDQALPGAEVMVQVAPEFVEVQISPGKKSP